jgi:hypothetical protein
MLDNTWLYGDPGDYPSADAHIRVMDPSTGIDSDGPAITVYYPDAYTNAAGDYIQLPIGADGYPYEAQYDPEDCRWYVLAGEREFLWTGVVNPSVISHGNSGYVDIDDGGPSGALVKCDLLCPDTGTISRGATVVIGYFPQKDPPLRIIAAQCNCGSGGS